MRRVVTRERTRGRQLRSADVYDIRCAALCGVTHEALGQVYGVAQSTITRAVNGVTYAHVPDPVEDVDEDGEAGFLPYARAAEWLSTASDDEVLSDVACRPRPLVSFAVMLRLMDLADAASGGC